MDEQDELSVSLTKDIFASLDRTHTYFRGGENATTRASCNQDGKRDCQCRVRFLHRGCRY